MQQERERPPAYTAHEPSTLNLPSVPTHELSNSVRHLPGIASLDLPAPPLNHASFNEHQELSPKSVPESGARWQVPQLPPLTSNMLPSVPTDVGSPMDTSSTIGIDDRARRGTSVLSVDDPDVRLAAEALSGLGNPDFVRSPTSRTLSLPPSNPQESEPLLSLITSNHPWLGGTINGSISAYTATKSYSPRFVKYGAELIERNIGSPMVNTVSSVGRRTGVERNLRRYLGEVHRRPSDLEQGNDEGGHKRRRVMSPSEDAMEVDESGTRTRGTSQSSHYESLPAYDDHRSPQYSESAVVVVDDKEQSQPDSAAQDRRVNWSTQLIMTTSGLGVALSETSLSSLRACLGLLHSATTHIDSVMQALKLVLEEYEQAIQSGQQDQFRNEKAAATTTTTAIDNDEDDTAKQNQVRAIAVRMQTLSSEIWTTLQKVTSSVSAYCGSALPQNAKAVVRTQLLSIRQRWLSADQQVGEEDKEKGDEVRGARRMLAFAKEGLDMIGQITTVVDGTVGSAEAWLGRMGRRGESAGPATGPAAPTVAEEKAGHRGVASPPVLPLQETKEKN